MNPTAELCFLITAIALMGTAILFWKRRTSGSSVDNSPEQPLSKEKVSSRKESNRTPVPPTNVAPEVVTGPWARLQRTAESDALYTADGTPIAIGGYSVDCRIKEGGTADVLRAYARDGKMFVIKLLKDAHMNNQDVSEQFLRECRVLRAIELKANSLSTQAERFLRSTPVGPATPASPSVPFGHGTLRPVPSQPQEGYWDRGRRLYLVMEFLDGEALDDVIAHAARQVLTTTDLLAVARDVSLALHLTHESGFCHMDLKPGNVLVWRDRSGRIARAKLIDFGAALPLQTPRLPIRLVTPNHASPELWTEGYGPRTDLYALGVTLYEMATGRLLSESETAPPIVPQSWDANLQRLLASAGLPLETAQYRITPAQTAQEMFERVTRMMTGPAADAARQTARLVFGASDAATPQVGLSSGNGDGMSATFSAPHR